MEVASLPNNVDAVYSGKSTGIMYYVNKCSIDDVLPDYTRIQEHVTVDVDYLNNMKTAIEKGINYRYIGSDGSSGFLYTLPFNKIAYGVSIYNYGSITGFVSLMATMFDDYPSDYIKVMPHTTSNFHQIKSLATDYSIQRYKLAKMPLTIDVKQQIAKFTKLYNKTLKRLK